MILFTMIKLYKFENDTVYYWEAWETDEEIVFHEGELGDFGDTQSISRNLVESARKYIDNEAKSYIAKGYRALADGEEYTLVVQYQVDGWGSAEDLAKRQQIEQLLNEVLGWTGNGHCDGGDIGSGTMNVSSLVVAPYLASHTIIDMLRENGLLEGAVIAIELEDSFEVLHPEDHEGEFAYWY
jgi:hypothetical protein